MIVGRGNGSARRKPAPVPLCPPQIPLDVTWTSTEYAVSAGPSVMSNSGFMTLVIV
jgi:hypothetical protein